MDKKTTIGNFLYRCLTKEEQEGFEKNLNKLDLSKPPKIINLEKDENGYKDYTEFKIKLLHGTMN